MVDLQKLYLQAMRRDLQVLADIVAIQHGPNAIQVHFLIGQLPAFFQNCKRKSGHGSKADCCGGKASIMASCHSHQEAEVLVDGGIGRWITLASCSTTI